MNPVELTRIKYQPPKVRILFVGESAPANGRFFYFGACGFTTHTRAAFEKIRGRQFASDGEFLNVFRDLGCWLDDISHTPVDKLKRREREAAILESTPEFINRLSAASPEVVIAMLKRIKGRVEEAVQTAGISPRVVEYLPFPGFGHQRKFVDGLVRVLRKTLY